jgi:hypothetical protein
MAKKLFLDFEDQIIYSIIGISSALKDYRLMFYLNKLSGFEFKRAEPFIFNINGTDFLYSLYIYLDHKNMRNYYLISNKANAVKLVKDFQHFDYILIMDGEIEDKYVSDLSKRIKSVSGINMSIEVDEEHLNKIPNLRFNFDLHLDKVLKHF